MVSRPSLFRLPSEQDVGMKVSVSSVAEVDDIDAVPFADLLDALDQVRDLAQWDSHVFHNEMSPEVMKGAVEGLSAFPEVSSLGFAFGLPDL